MKKQSFFVGSVVLMVSMIATKALGLIYKIPLTNLLGGEGMSCYSTAYSIFMPLFAVAVSGLSGALSRLVSINLSFKRYKNALKIKRTAFWFFASTGLLCSLAVAAAGYPICVYALHSKEAYLSLAALSPGIFFASILSVERGFFEGGQNMNPTCVSEITESILRVIFGLGGAYLGIFIAQNEFASAGTVFGTVCESTEDAALAAAPYVSAFSLLGVSASTAAACLYLFIASRLKRYRFTKVQLDLDKVNERRKNIISSLVAIAVPMALCSVITTLTGIIDTLTITPILSSFDRFGEYGEFVSKLGVDFSDAPSFIYGSYTGLALTVFGLAPSLTAMLGKSALPDISKLFAQKKFNKVGTQSNTVLTLTSLIAIPAGIGISVFSKELLTLLFHSRTAEIEAAAGSLKILGIGVPLTAITITLFSLLQAIGKAGVPIKILLAALPVKLILNALLISRGYLNISGAAAGTVGFYTVTAVSALFMYKKYTGLKFKLSDSLFKPIYAGSVCAAAGKLCMILLTDYCETVTNTLISFAVSVIIYILSLSLLFNFHKKSPRGLFFSRNA